MIFLKGHSIALQMLGEQVLKELQTWNHKMNNETIRSCFINDMWFATLGKPSMTHHIYNERFGGFIHLNVGNDA